MDTIMRHPEDLNELPQVWKEEAGRAIEAIAINPEQPPGYRVDPLGYQEKMYADLSGLLSLKFSGTEFDDAFRIVYRILNGQQVEIVAVGLRQGSKVYKLVRDRLFPRPPARRIRTAARKPAYRDPTL